MVPLATAVMMRNVPIPVSFLIGITIRVACRCRLDVRDADLLGRMRNTPYRDGKEKSHANYDVEQPVHAMRDSTCSTPCQDFTGHADRT